jgi:hypothetical protein
MFKVRRVIDLPHILPAVTELRAEFRAEGIELEVCTGGEIALDSLAIIEAELLGFGLASNPNYLLLEFPYYAAVKALGDFDLARWLTDDVPAAIVANTPIPERRRSQRVRMSFRR